VLPASRWNAFSGRRVSYRLLTSTRADGWHDVVRSTPDATTTDVPFVAVPAA
jgi:hypothetical protein